MQEQHLIFIDACKYLFDKYGLSKNTSTFFAPVKEWSNETTKKVGYYKLNVAKKHHDYKAVAPFLTDEIAKDYNCVSVESFEAAKEVGETKKLSLLTVSATPDYPIFAYQFSDFAKMYEPKAVKNDKGYSSKHHFLGTKPERQIYGWDRLFKMVDFGMIEVLFDNLKRAPEHKRESIRTEIDTYKLDNVIIATGGSDGLNLASLGYNVIWFNSEAEIITTNELYQLQKICKTVYYVPDLDKTGVKQAVAMGLMS
jgi:hypothetical protein